MSSDKFEKIIYLGKNETKFRRANELFYMMKEIKKKKCKQVEVPTLEDELLKIDIDIQGFKIIKSIPVELCGTRSFLMTEKSDDDVDFYYDEEEANPKPKGVQKRRNQTVKRKTVKKIKEEQKEEEKADQLQSGSSSRKIALLCKVHFEGQNKRVSLISSLVFANNSRNDVHLAGIREKSDAVFEEDVKKTIKIAPNEVFVVPLSWFIKEKYIYLKEQDGYYRRIFSDNIRKTFDPEKDHFKQGFKSRSVEVAGNEHVAINLASFKCKPSQLKVPSQFLITFTPPFSICNYLFNEL